MPDPTSIERPTQDSLSGRATGSFFFTGFGVIWVLTGLSGMHRLLPVIAILMGLLGATLVAAGVLLLRRAKAMPAGDVDPVEQARVERVFNAVNIIQWVAVATAVVILILLGRPAYIVPAIAIIVGLHLFPLAGAFRYPLHYVTGTALIGWSVGCIAMLPAASIPGVGAFGTGCILLVSSAVTLAIALQQTRSTAGAAIQTEA